MPLETILRRISWASLTLTPSLLAAVRLLSFGVCSTCFRISNSSNAFLSISIVTDGNVSRKYIKHYFCTERIFVLTAIADNGMLRSAMAKFSSPQGKAAGVHRLSDLAYNKLRYAISEGQ